MSAFLCSTETLSCIAKGLKFHYEISTYNTIDYILSDYTGLDLIIKSSNFEEKFYNNLLETNLKSLGYRYNDSKISDWYMGDSSDYTYDIKTPRVTKKILYDLISCWLYQSCEGEANKTEFYLLVKDLRNFIAHDCMGGTKHWGISSYKDLEESDKTIADNAFLISDMFK